MKNEPFRRSPMNAEPELHRELKEDLIAFEVRSLEPTLSYQELLQRLNLTGQV